MLLAMSRTIDLVAAIPPVLDVLVVRDPDLARQLRRALNAVHLNVAEGTRRQGRDQKNRYRIAAGEAQEVKAALALAHAWGYIDDKALAPLWKIADHVGALTYGLAK